MLRTPLFKKVVFLGALVGATLAHAGFEYRIPIRGLALGAGASVPVSLSPVGDGVSKEGACASGTATGCATMLSTTSYAVSSDGLTVTYMGGWVTSAAKATVSKSSGKWYWEVTSVGASSPSNSTTAAGLVVSSFDAAGSTNCFGCTVDNMTWAGSPFLVMYQGAYSGRPLPLTNFGSTNYSVGTTMGFALDLDAKTLTVTRNGVLRWTISGIPEGAWAPVVSTGGQSHTDTLNFGQSAFQYAVPAGYNAGLW